MTSIEHDIIQQFAQLDTHTQQRIFIQLHAYMHIPKNFDFDAWRQNVHTLNDAPCTDNHALNALHELRAGEDDA